MADDPNKVLMYNPLGEEQFNKDSFQKGYSELQGLEKILKTIREDALNPQAIQLAGKILHGMEDFYYKAGEINNVRPQVEQALSEAQKGLEKYVEKNLHPMSSYLSDQDYSRLIQLVKAEKKEGAEKQNELAKAQDEFNKFKEAIQDEQKIFGYLAEKMKKAPKWAQAEFSRMSSNPRYIQLMAQAYGGFFKNQYDTVFAETNHKEVFNNSLSLSKKKGDYYTVIAKGVAESEKLAA